MEPFRGGRCEKTNVRQIYAMPQTELFKDRYLDIVVPSVSRCHAPLRALFRSIISVAVLLLGFKAGKVDLTHSP